MRHLKRAIAVLALIASAGCGDSVTGSSQLMDAAGTWSGTLTSNIDGPGTITMTLVQSGTSVAGTYTADYTSFVDGQTSGSLSGNVVGSGVVVTLTRSDPTFCPSRATGTVASNGISGTFAAFDCSASASRTFSVVRQ